MIEIRGNSQKALKIQDALNGSYEPKDNCPICFEIMDPALSDRLGVIVIHDGKDGFKHPMHATCLKIALCSQAQFREIKMGKCPVCRALISYPKPPGLFEKTIQVGTFIAFAAMGHAALSQITNQPKLIAMTPGICSSLMAINAVFVEREELGLRGSLIAEIAKKVAVPIAVIGVSFAASATASQITDSRISNSVITATLGTVGLMPLVMKFMNPLNDN